MVSKLRKWPAQDPGGKRGGQTEGQTQEGRERWAGRKEVVRASKIVTQLL